jgi:hypothetical protein
MMTKNVILFFLLLFVLPVFSQESDTTEVQKKRSSRLNVGLGLNIPFEPNSVNYDIGMGISERYEFLLWDHFSLVQSLSYNFVSGQKVQEYYEGRYVQTQYENYNTVPLQFGIGFYFGENQRKFFILLKGGWAYYWGVNPAYPEIVVNGNVVKPAIPRTEFDGTYGFFTPTIGWQFKWVQISATYQGTVNQDASINILNLTLSYTIL